MTRHRPAFTLVVVLAGLVLAACSSPSASGPEPSDGSSAPSSAETATATPDTGAPTPGTALNACEIVTAADIAAALGPDVVVEDGHLQEAPTTLSPGKTLCHYEGEWGGIVVDLVPEDGVNLFDAAAGAYDDAEDLGLGDGSFWSPNTSRAFVLKGSVNVMLQITFLTDSSIDRGNVASALCSAVVDKL